MTIESSNNPQGFTQFEHDGWEAVSKDYERHAARLTIQSVKAVLDAAAVSDGCSVLDVCTGPGMLASAAIDRGAHTTGIDFASEAIEIASSKVPNADFQVGDAQALPYESGSFDSVVCGFGIIHLPDPRKGLGEMNRVLKPGGRVAVSVWVAPMLDNGFGLLFGAIKANADMDVELPHGPDFFQFSDTDKLSRALVDVGFKNPSVTLIPQFWEFPEAAGLATSIIEGSVRARGLIMAQTDPVKKAIVKAVQTEMETYRGPDGLYRVPMPALVGAAHK